MHIRALMENTTLQPELLIEHGLSLYIEVGEHKILFDMGQSDAFITNAVRLGVDLRQVDIAILSHGHYDHGGGLHAFLELNEHAVVYINENAFIPHFSGTEKAIGINPNLRNHERVIITQNHFVIDQGISLHTGNAFCRSYVTNSVNLFQVIDGRKEIDLFLHEQYLLLEEKGQRILISGCSHKGILNIMKWFSPDILIGGFHYKHLGIIGEDQLRLQYEALQLMQYRTKYFTCHCTGISQYKYLKSIMGEQLQYLATGDRIQI